MPPAIDPPDEAGKRQNNSNILPRMFSRVESSFVPDFSFEGSSKWICDDGVARSGNRWTATAHIICVMIGVGVLALPYSQAGMGWILGPICLLAFSWVMLFSSNLLADLYIIDGRRMRTFPTMVRYVFGKWGMIIVGILQQLNMVLITLAFTITAAQEMNGIAQMATGTDTGDAWYMKLWPMGVMYGGVQIFFSQLPNLDKFWWASVIGAMMSIGYCTITLGFAIAYRGTEGGIEPMQMGSTAATVWNVFECIGTVMWAYSFATVLIEIEDTISDARTRGEKSTPGPVSSMKWAVNLSVGIMTFFYCSIAWTVFASLGYNQTGFALDDYQGIAPDWILYMARVMVVIHLVPAYQVMAQPHFAMVETWLDRTVFKERVPYWIVRVGYRSVYVCIVTFIGVLLPFFNAMIGLMGALSFWPIALYFPVRCWRKVYKPKRALNALLWAVDITVFIIALAVIVASVETIIQEVGAATLWS